MYHYDIVSKPCRDAADEYVYAARRSRGTQPVLIRLSKDPKTGKYTIPSPKVYGKDFDRLDNTGKLIQIMWASKLHSHDVARVWGVCIQYAQQMINGMRPVSDERISMLRARYYIM